MIRALLCLVMLAGVSAPAGDDLLTNSRAPYVHNITLYDAEGRVVRPSRGSTTPFSMEATCAKCHDVTAISKGLHFNANLDEVEHGRPGEPWILNDYQTGTQIPISYRGWEGTWRPRDLGITDKEFLQLFGRHLPGGGPGKPNPHDIDSASALGDVFEMDCMICHTSGSGVYNINDRKRLAETGQFQSIFVQATGLGVGEYADDSPTGATSGNPFADFDPALEEGERREIVKFIYNRSRFDDGDLAHFPITRRISNEACYQCHTSIRHERDMTKTGWHQDYDVHLIAGMQCVDCHRHGIDHKMTRGFQGEVSNNPFAQSLSCQGCHYGVETDNGIAFTGRMGAPIPGHEGFPPIHFEVLSCTACHSGPIPEETTHFWQTSMAHALGFPEFGRGNKTTPLLNAPIFLKGEDGKIAPHKVMWPAFWGWKKEGEITPILPRDVLKLTGRTLTGRPRSMEKAEPLSEETITEALAVLAAGASRDKTPVYIAAGMKRMLAGTELSVSPTEIAQPYAWAMAHDVRPAGMALGARGCQECHASDSPFLSGRVLPSGPILGQGGEGTAMGVLMGLDMTLQRWWAAAFLGRPLFKFLAVLMMILTLLGAVTVSVSLLRSFAERFR